ncbi:MAG: hypothetical protein WC533_00840 [Candidatus Pacearchaeota archaeon]
MGIFKKLEDFFTLPNTYEELQQTGKIVTQKVSRALLIHDLAWNYLIFNHKNKFSYYPNSYSVNEYNNEIIFNGEFNIKSKKEDIYVKLEINGEKKDFKIILIKEPRSKEAQKLN